MRAFVCRNLHVDECVSIDLLHSYLIPIVCWMAKICLHSHSTPFYIFFVCLSIAFFFSKINLLCRCFQINMLLFFFDFEFMLVFECVCNDITNNYGQKFLYNCISNCTGTQSRRKRNSAKI